LAEARAAGMSAIRASLRSHQEVTPIRCGPRGEPKGHLFIVKARKDECSILHTRALSSWIELGAASAMRSRCEHRVAKRGSRS
jgi:hypothetical protein